MMPESMQTHDIYLVVNLQKDAIHCQVLCSAEVAVTQ